MIEEGDRVELIRTSDPYTDLEPGDEGTVDRVVKEPWGVDGHWKAWVDWDSGSRLAMIQGEDTIRKVDE